MCVVIRTVLKDAEVDSTCMHNDQCCALNSHTYSMYWGILKYMHSKRRKGLAVYDMWPLELNDSKQSFSQSFSQSNSQSFSTVNSHYYAIHELFFAV